MVKSHGSGLKNETVHRLRDKEDWWHIAHLATVFICVDGSAGAVMNTPLHIVRKKLLFFKLTLVNFRMKNSSLPLKYFESVCFKKFYNEIEY